MPERDGAYALAIHGGAGTLPREQLTPAREREYLQALRAALESGRVLLEAGASALAAVEAAVVALEDEPLFNAGRGAVLTRDGTVELDASIMDGTDLRAGAVACVRRVRNPIRLARRLLEASAPVLLVADGAERLAREYGLDLVPNGYFVTPHRTQQLEEWRQRAAAGPSGTTASFPELDAASSGTVGAVACDRHGRLAAATSTGGLTGKLAGRVGDSPIVGAGTYADNRTCAVSMTGHGEWFLRTVQAYDICARMQYAGSSLEQAVSQAITGRLPSLGAAGGLIAVDGAGQIVMRHNTPAMFRACVRSGQGTQVHIF